MTIRPLIGLALSAFAISLAGCNSGGVPVPSGNQQPPPGGGGGGGGGGEGGARTFMILDDATVADPAYDEQDETLAAMFLAGTGDVIEFGEGTFDYTTTLVMSQKSGITIRGQGLDKTILNFSGSNQPEGISMSHMEGVTIEDLTVIDTPGFSVKISDSNHVVLRNMRTMWSSADGGMDPEVPSTLDVTCRTELSFPESVGTYTDAVGAERNYMIDSANGGYALYPVLSNDILLDNVIAIGASDAGIYVGQSNDVIVKNSLAIFNVAGYEIENTDDADMHDNIAECNTAGFLVFDLPGLNQYGDETRIFNNIARYNNTPNFAPGGIVSAVPQGIGILQLGYDEVEIFNNTIEFNRTVGFVNASHELLEGSAENVADLRMDLYGEGIHIHDNVFTTNGTAPQPPEDGAITCAPGTGPGFDDVPPCAPTGIDDSHDSLLPALIMVKGSLAGDGYGPTGAHIVWDGMFDDQPYPCDLAPEFAGKVDENGKPQYDGEDMPECRYNAYKFGPTGERKHPKYWQCYHTNEFSQDSRTYMNFENTDPTDPPETDPSVHDCELQFGAVLTPLDPAVVEPYTPQSGGSTTLTEEQTLAICQNFSGTNINRDAVMQANCPQLSQYNLFADATDPRSGFNEGGVLFDLTTPLFSDYALKYRVLYLPPGGQASWFVGDESQPNQNLRFPVGTVIAKTFAFRNGADEDVVETRLLIHRPGNNDSTFWQGMAYIWETDESGNRTDAFLAVSGGNQAASWNFDDPDPDVNVTYIGSTDNYAIPHPNQCGNCHQNDDYDPGSAPIGTRVRLLNRAMDYNGQVKNQLQHWKDIGILAGAPDLSIDGNNIATNAPRLPRFNVPGDVAIIPGVNSIHDPASAEFDVEMRARAWMETNCAHCHNRKGLARSTGVFFDVFKPVDLSYGICKTPTTAGSSSGGNQYDIVPGSASDSIVSFRINSTDAGAQMPPLARSVAHAEGAALIDQWIDTVVNGSYPDATCAP